MKKTKLTLLAAGLLGASLAPANIIEIPTVFVGDAGNANDSTGFGGVSYDYHIGTHEVTNGQYASFLNSVAARSSTPAANCSPRSAAATVRPSRTKASVSASPASRPFRSLPPTPRCWEGLGC